jgi:hypothetical protein
MSRLLASFLILAACFVIFAGSAESQDQKRKPFGGKVIDINKDSEGKVSSFNVQVSPKVNKSILVNDETTYDYMNKPAKVDVIVVGAAISAVYNKAGSDYASIVKITTLPKK